MEFIRSLQGILMARVVKEMFEKRQQEVRLYVHGVKLLVSIETKSLPSSKVSFSRFGDTALLSQSSEDDSKAAIDIMENQEK